MIERSRTVRESDAVFDLDEGHSAETPRLTRVKHPHLNVPGFDEVLHQPKIKAVLQALLGPTVRLQTTKLNTKAPVAGRRSSGTRTGRSTPTRTTISWRSG